MTTIRSLLAALVLIALPVAALAQSPYIEILGIAQDGGHPQAGCTRPDCIAAWRNPKLRKHVASVAIVDPLSKQQWIIDATPDFPEQLTMLDSPKIDGIFLTHAHIGHYLGLAQLGREVMGTHDLPVYAMPRMRAFLEHNGPWDQLVRIGNIKIESLENERAVRLNDRITITPVLVPHRDEYSETVAFIVRGPNRSILWLPDIDRLPEKSLVDRVDIAFIDGTFYDEKELPGRKRSEIPHPVMVDSMKAFSPSKVRFIHLNQSNPALHDPSIVKPFQVAKERERIKL